MTTTPKEPIRTLATQEELLLIRESVLLPFLLPIIALNFSELENRKDASQALLKRLYIAAAQRLRDDIEADIRRIKIRV